MNYKDTKPLMSDFFKIDLLMDFAALLYLTDFIDWRYIHSWLVFSNQLVNCCPLGPRSYTCVVLPLYLLSDPPPPSQTQRVAVGGGGVQGGRAQHDFSLAWLEAA